MPHTVVFCGNSQHTNPTHLYRNQVQVNASARWSQGFLVLLIIVNNFSVFTLYLVIIVPPQTHESLC